MARAHFHTSAEEGGDGWGGEGECRACLLRCEQYRMHVWSTYVTISQARMVNVCTHFHPSVEEGIHLHCNLVLPILTLAALDNRAAVRFVGKLHSVADAEDRNSFASGLNVREGGGRLFI